MYTGCKQYVFIFEVNLTFVKSMGILLCFQNQRFYPRCFLADFKARTINSTGSRNTKSFIIFLRMRQLLKKTPFPKLHWITQRLKIKSSLRINSIQWLLAWTKFMAYCKKQGGLFPHLFYTHICMCVCAHTHKYTDIFWFGFFLVQTCDLGHYSPCLNLKLQ